MSPATSFRWPVSAPAIACRSLLRIPIAVFLDRLVRVEIRGAEVLRDLRGPALLAANHTSHLDTIVLRRALPPGHRLAVAAAADYFFANPFLGAIAALAANAFPLPRGGCPKSALHHCTWLLDRGWSILLYPEGTRSRDGRIGRFRPGVGWLAARLGCPVVPVHLAGLHQILPKGARLPRPGTARVRFGALHWANGEATLAEFANEIEGAVRRLAAGGV